MWPAITLGGSLLMMPLGVLFVMGAGYLGFVSGGEAPLMIIAVILGVSGAYLPYVGALLFLFFLFLWVRVHLIERQSPNEGRR
jgi:hypothetical protein